MTQIEEIFAQELYKDLKKKFPSRYRFWSKLFKRHNDSLVTIALERAGTQSNCKVTSPTRQCKIYCHDGNRALEFNGPIFSIYFSDNGKEVSASRTFDRDDALSAIQDWIGGRSLPELYLKYPFVDQEKRQLEVIQEKLRSQWPEFNSIAKNEVAILILFYEYRLEDGERGCRIYFYGYEKSPRFVLFWSGALIDEFESANMRYWMLLVKKWIVDKEMPSALEIEFPGLRFGKLATYYEAGQGIEGEFIISWDDLETYYEGSPEIVQFLGQMRQKGFDKVLRAGTSIYNLILSRSRRHGLREGQNFLRFQFDIAEQVVIVSENDDQRHFFDEITLNATIEDLLHKLAREKID